MFKPVSMIAVLAVASVGQTLTLSTTMPNNGAGGVFMELTPLVVSLDVTSFDTYFSSPAGNAVQIEVWTRTGTFSGFDASSAGWTLTQTSGAVSNGSNIIASLPLNTVINLPIGQITSVYLHAVTVGGGIQYTGTSALPPQTTWANADLSLMSNRARTGAVSFAGNTFSPRTFAGNVNYEAIPEPTSMAILGLGAIALLRRKKSK